MNAYTVTARQAREALFYVRNQGLTAEQLRAILFDIEDQDAPLSFNWDEITQNKAARRNSEQAVNA